MRNSIYATAAVFLLLLAGSCNTATGPETGHGQDGKAAVSLAIAGTDSRSVLPSNAALADVAQWRLQGGKTDEFPDWLTDLFADYVNKILYLETGVWNFTLEGYKDESGEIPILRGTLTGQTISLEEPNILSFEVAPLKEGEGTVQITITLPEGHGIDRVEVLKDYEAYHPDPPIAPVEDSIFFEGAFPAGDYYFSFQLYKGEDDLYGVVSELVQVRQNLTSKETYNLEQKDLNLLYVITYHPNYGKPEEDILLEYYQYTDAGVTLPIPARPGYIFGGWYDNENCTGDEVTVILRGDLGNKDFYAAEWILVDYNIIYKPDGGISYGDNPKTYTVENPIITLKDPPLRNGFSFGGWYSDDQFKEPITGSLEIPTDSLGDKTFYAKWIPRYTITFNTHGGSEVAPITEDEGTEVVKPTPTRDGYRFLGWFDETGRTKYTWPHTLTRDVTMHAQWVRQYTITFNTHGGTEVLAITQDENTTVNEPAEPTKDGFRFLGWFSQADGGTEYDDDDWPYTLTGNVTMHAQWKPPASIKINTLQPASDPSLTGDTTVLSQNEPATFTIESDSGISNIIWYWDGEPIGGETEASYTLAAYSQSPGIYELFVLVTGKDGERLSARRRIVIIAVGRGGR
jgi:uncharacterized repeat protein (TIGR02543 family)